GVARQRRPDLAGTFALPGAPGGRMPAGGVTGPGAPEPLGDRAEGAAGVPAGRPTSGLRVPDPPGADAERAAGASALPGAPGWPTARRGRAAARPRDLPPHGEKPRGPPPRHP